MLMQKKKQTYEHTIVSHQISRLHPALLSRSISRVQHRSFKSDII